MLKEVLDLIRAVEEWPGVSFASDRTGLSFTAGGVVIGHLRWDGRLDLAFTPVIRDQLIAEDMAASDPDRPETEGVVFAIRAPADVGHAVWLLQLAYLLTDPEEDDPAADLAWDDLMRS